LACFGDITRCCRPGSRHSQHLLGAIALLGLGAPAALLFTILHGAGNGI
jgi:hypothetical protein